MVGLLHARTRANIKHAWYKDYEHPWCKDYDSDSNDDDSKDNRSNKAQPTTRSISEANRKNKQRPVTRSTSKKVSSGDNDNLDKKLPAKKKRISSS